MYHIIYWFSFLIQIKFINPSNQSEQNEKNVRTISTFSCLLAVAAVFASESPPPDPSITTNKKKLGNQAKPTLGLFE